MLLGLLRRKITLKLLSVGFLLIISTRIIIEKYSPQAQNALSTPLEGYLQMGVSDRIGKKRARHKAFGVEKSQLLRNTFNAFQEPSVGIGADNQTHKDKYLIYWCEEGVFCGGLIDRLKGISAAYLIANLTGRTFKMEMRMKSCDFHRFIVPNAVDWYLPEPFHEKIEPGDDVSIYSTFNDGRYLRDVDHDFSLNVPLNHTYVYYRGNMEYFMKFRNLRLYQDQLSWMNNLTYSEIVNALYRRLFRPSEYLQSKTQAFLNSNLRPHEKLVCAHLRMGPNPSIPEDFRLYTVSSEGIAKTWTFLANISKLNDSKIFLMSDSKRIIVQAKNTSFANNVISSPGRIVHVDRSKVKPEVKCEGLEKIIFEHYLLFHCDVLLISRSGIGIHAASVRASDNGLYCLRKPSYLLPCTRQDLDLLYALTKQGII